jgi:hypothetical protein
MANGIFKMKMDIDRHKPDFCLTTVNILTRLISRYQLPLNSQLAAWSTDVIDIC